MERLRSLLRALRPGIWTALLLWSSLARAEPGVAAPLRPIPESDSPNGEYALAWSIRGASASDWSRLQALDSAEAKDDGQGAAAMSLFFERLAGKGFERIENHVVHKKTGRSLSVLKGFHYWRLAALHPSHPQLILAWAPGSDHLLVMEELSRTWGEVALLEFAEGRVVRSQAVGSLLCKLAVSALAKTLRTAPKRATSPADLRCSAASAAFLAPDRVQLRAYIFKPMTAADQTPFDYEGELAVRILPPAGSALRIELESLKPVTSGP